MKIPAKTPEEHKYTSTGIKFWRHPEQMNNYINKHFSDKRFSTCICTSIDKEIDYTVVVLLECIFDRIE